MKKSDVIVVGAGPLGWACSQLLAKMSINATLIDSALNARTLPWIDSGLGVFWPSLNDPPTRTVVAHGTEMAQWLQDFCVQGLEVAKALLGSENLIETPSLRIGLENFEIVELNSACQAGLGLKPSASLGSNIFAEINDSLVVRDVFTQRQDASFNSKIDFYNAKVQNILETKDGCSAFLNDGSQLHSEMIIIATGYKIAELESWLSPMLIPMSDVMSNWATSLMASENSTPISIRTSSGHVAAVFIPTRTSSNVWQWHLKMTGPRFLLPQAGAGVDLTKQPLDNHLCSRIEAWIQDSLLAKVAPLLLQNSSREAVNDSHKISLKLLDMRMGVDCLPCDELPMLGELGHQGRILGATGWLGCGWSAGFQAASTLVDIVQTGKSDQLKALLRPQRWRSGMNDGVTGMT